MGSLAGARRLSAAVSGLAAVGYVVSILRERATANAYGTGLELDSYLVAYTVVTFVALTPTRALYDPLVVIVAAERERDSVRHAALVRTFLAIMATALVILSLVVLADRGGVLMAMAPGMEPNGLMDAGRLLLLLTPAIVLLGLSEVTRAALHAYEEFLASSVIPILGSLVTLVAIVAFAEALGIDALAFGVVTGGALQLVVATVVLRRYGVFRSWSWASRADLAPFVAPLGAGVVLAGASSLSIVIDRFLGSQLPVGRIAALNYASRMTDTAVVVCVSGIATILYPRLARFQAQRDIGAFGTTLRRSIIGAVAVTLPTGIGMALLAGPLVGILFGGGRFDAQSQRITSEALAGYAVALPVIAAATLIARSLYALRRIDILIAQAIVFLIAKATIGMILIGPLAHVGVALASGAAYALVTFLTAAALTREIQRQRDL